MLLAVSRKSKICRGIHVVVGMEHAGASLALELNHHQFNDVVRDWMLESNPIVLLKHGCPAKANVSIAQIRLAIHFSALVNNRCDFVRHIFLEKTHSRITPHVK